MAVSLPNGVTIALATAYGSAKTVTAITNANPGVATSTSHGLANGAYLAVTSGWSRLGDRIVRVSGTATNTFNLEGIDTSSLTAYPAGSGIGSVVEITTWTQVAQILDLQSSGGEQQFTNYSFLENDYETQLPTQASPITITISIADDPSLAGYIAIKAAAESRATRALRLTLPNGSVLVYNGYVSLNETPTLTKNTLNQVRATFSLLQRPTRYAS
jgi:hypothetical protein